MGLRVVRQNDSQHFRDRLFQRFGILLTASDMWPLRDRLKTAKRIIFKEGVATYQMVLQGKLMRVVYDSYHDRFVTATLFTEEELEKVYTNP